MNISQEIGSLREKVERLRGRKAQIQSSLNRIKQQIRDCRISLREHEEAREIVRLVGQKTQEQLQFHISDITTMALNTVFDDPYEMKMEFVQRRNKTECDLKFVRGELEIDPIEASGVGAIDVASFALRIASWSMKRPHSRNTIILDEPFRYLSTNYQSRASEMLKEISRRLGIQFIIITHEEELSREADKIFEVSIHNQTSKVK